MDHCGEQKREINPREKTNIFSVLTFFYTLSLFKKGWKADLKEDDIYQVIKSCNSKDCGNKLEAQFAIEKKRNQNNPSIAHLLWACFGWRYVFLGMIHLVWKVIKSVVEPEAIAKLTFYFIAEQHEMSKKSALFYAQLLLGIKLLHFFYYQNYEIYLKQLAIQIRASFCSLIYRKSLKLSQKALGSSEISLGNMVTLITKDVTIFEHSISLFNDFWIALIETVVVFYLIYVKVGIACVAGVGILFLILPAQVYFGKKITKIRLRINKKADERLQATQETLSAIKIIKMYTWEAFFLDKINHTRKIEMQSIVRIFYLKLFTYLSGGLCSKIGFYVLVMTYIWLGNNISADVLFYVLTCFHRLTHNIEVLFPIGLVKVAEMYASIKRIKFFLSAEEVTDLKYAAGPVLKPTIQINNVTTKIGTNTILSDIDLKFSSGLTVLTGALGGGKSSLLKTILQDFPVEKGTVFTQGRISYASQDPWLFPSSIKQNILFGEKYYESRYKKVVKVCSLEYDFELLENGDETIVADRGINLSKGQQARINLARAVYKKSEIYLLDDSLTALDAHVQESIFKNCIRGFLRNKLTILVSHNPLHLSCAENVVVLAHGRVLNTEEFNINDLIENNLNDDDGGEHLNSEKEPKELDDVDESSKLLEAKDHQKVYQEVNKTGSINWDVYKQYITFGGGFLAFSLIIVIFFVAQASDIYTTKLLTQWVNYQEITTNLQLKNTTNSTSYAETVAQSNWTLNLYTIMIFTSSVLLMVKYYVLLSFTMKASVQIHKHMVDHIVNSLTSFFDNNFIGNILNRFSQDLNVLDESIAFMLMASIRMVFGIGGVVILIATVNWFFLIPSLIFFVIMVFLRIIYMPTGRSLKRLEAASRSPLVGHINASLDGITTIRAYNAQDILTNEFDRHQDLYTSATFTSYCMKKSFAFFMDLFSVAFLASIIFNLLFNDKMAVAGNVGLAISQATDFAHKVQFGLMIISELENLMTSVERVLQYTHLQKETKTGTLVEKFGQVGKIDFIDVSLNYSNSEKILKNLNFSVESNEKIGIVGRTGAGKSSIISTLFRLYDFSGTILIDDLDSKTVTLKCLREALAIIPQDPILFSGTIRSNIDPKQKFSDPDIWSVIKRCKLSNIIKDLDLDIDDCNFSTGQRQMICLARAVIRDNKIVILDEATANMDPATDLLIQESIKENFAQCTMFIIAHRLHSVMDCDKVLVLNNGNIIEFDTPQELLLNESGDFYAMVKQAGLLE